MHTLRPLAPALLALALAACGGSASNPYHVALDRPAVLIEADYQGPAPATQQVRITFVGDGVVVGYPPGAAMASDWLNVSMPSTATGGQVTLTLGVVTTFAAPATRSTTLRIVTGKADGSAYVYQDLPVTYVLYDAPKVSPAALTFTGVASAAAGPAVQPLAFTLGDQASAWTIQSDQPWLTVDRPQGTGSATVQVHASPAGLAAGGHAGHLSVRAVGGRAAATATVQFSVRPRRIWAAQEGVALTDLPGRAALQRDVALFDNSGAAGAYAASPDQAWLAAAPLPGGKVRITADPAALPAGLSVGTVTVTSDGAGVENAATIRVGLWKGDAASSEGALVDLLPRDVGPYPTLSLVVDPIRPRLYLLDGGSVISGFNVHTGALEVTFPALDGEALGSLVPSSDGRWLYAGSTVNPLVHRLDLDAGAWDTPLAYAGANAGASFATFLRPEGWPLLLGTVALDLVAGAPITTHLVSGSALDDATLLEDQGHLVAAVLVGLDYDRAAGVLSSSMIESLDAIGGMVVGAAADGSLVASGGSLAYGYGWHLDVRAADGTYALAKELPCLAYPASIAFGDGGVLYAGRNAYYDPDTVTAYDPSGAVLGGYSIGTYRSLLPKRRGLMLSSDGLRLLLVSSESAYGAKTTLWGFATQP